MSAVAQPMAVPAREHERQPSGWDHLKTLVPYVLRYKGMTALGLLALALMGLVGALPQLIVGAITDCLKGSPVALSTLTGCPRAVLHPLFRFIRPAQPPRAGPLLPDSRGRHDGERILLLSGPAGS